MTKKHNKSNDGLGRKMDKLLDKFSSVEEKLDKRMSKIENDYKNLSRKSEMHEKKQKYLSTEVSKLKSKLNEIEQEKLRCNVLIRGLKEVETSGEDLLFMVNSLLCTFYKNLHNDTVTDVRRIGSEASNSSTKPVLVVFESEKIKESVMNAKKGKSLDCSMIRLRSSNEKVGMEADTVYISDHLTPYTATIYYHARQLKKNSNYKYAWTKNGKVYVRRNETDRAILLKNIEQINNLEKSRKQILSSTKNNENDESSNSTSGESSDEESSDHEEQAEEEEARYSNKRNRSDVSQKKSPKPKRPNTRSNK